MIAAMRAAMIGTMIVTMICIADPSRWQRLASAGDPRVMSRETER